MPQLIGKKISEVLETKDYSKFISHQENRVITQSHVNSLCKKMKRDGWLKTSIVVVNEKFQIIDGHHRILAATLAEVPVRYIVSKGSNGDDISQMNMGQLKWSPYDHISKYVKRGNINYINLAGFIERHPQFRITDCSKFCKNSSSEVDRDVFEQGRWESGDIEIAEDWANKVKSLEPFFENGFNKSIFVRAMVKVLSTKPEFNFKEFLHKVEIRQSMLFLCGSIVQYTEMIERIYNFGRREDTRLNLRY